MSDVSIDALGAALAREDHRQGKPLGELGHCESCDGEALRQARERERQEYARLLAACSHEDWLDISTLARLPGTSQICATCGIERTQT